MINTNILRLRVFLFAAFIALSPFTVYYSFQLGAIIADAHFFSDMKIHFPTAPVHNLWYTAFHITCIIAVLGYVVWEWLGSANTQESVVSENNLGTLGTQVNGPNY